MSKINKSIPKLDGQGLVLGRPAYTADLSRDHDLVVKILRSPHAHAIIKKIDTSRAAALAGVVCVLSHKDLDPVSFTRAGQSYPEPSPYDSRILDKRLRYIGDPVAILAAQSEAIAKEALLLIDVEYDVKTPLLDYEQALDHPLIVHPESHSHCKVDIGYEPKRNRLSHLKIEKGDVTAALDQCQVRHQATYRTQAQAQAMMEPFTSAASLDLQGRLLITTSTQIPFHVRRTLGLALGLPLSRIRVVKPRIGGGFGGKQTMAGELYVAAVTLATGRSSRITYSRKETFEATTCRHPMRLTITLGASPDGKLQAIDVEALGNTGAYGEHGATVMSGACFKGMPLYANCPVRFEGQMVYTNLRPAGAMRGYGVTQLCFAMESAMDELAHLLKMDPIDLREINMISTGHNYNPMGTADQVKILQSCALPQCISLGKEAIGWQGQQPIKASAKHLRRGQGMALSMQGSGLAGVDMAAATIKLNDDGFFNLLMGATDLGTGSDTILSQIAAEALGVDIEQIIPYSSDTDLTPFDSGAYASSTTYLSGRAVQEAAQALGQEIIAEAALFFHCSIKDVSFQANQLSDGKSKTISLADFSQQRTYINKQKQLSVTRSFVGKDSPPPFIAAFAEVEVDVETGKIEVIHYAAAADCGTPINPNLARIQIEGGSVQGIGMALFEEAQMNKQGRLRHHSFFNYKIPARTDIGPITALIADSEEPTGPFGAKSLGEVVINPASPAIINAIFHATGLRFRSLPVRPEDLAMAWKSKEDR